MTMDTNTTASVAQITDTILGLDPATLKGLVAAVVAFAGMHGISKWQAALNFIQRVAGSKYSTELDARMTGLESRVSALERPK